MYQRILSSIDGSPCSERAGEEAIELSAALRSEIRILHVADLYRRSSSSFSLLQFSDGVQLDTTIWQNGLHFSSPPESP